MAEAFGVGLAGEATKALTQLVATGPLEKIRLVWCFKDHFRKLKRKFKYMEAFLEDIGSANYQGNLELVNLWLEHVKDVVYFTEDIMDEYGYENLRAKLESRSVFKRASQIKFRFQMTRKVSKILAKFEELEMEAQNIGLKMVNLAMVARRSGTYDDNVNVYANNLRQLRELAGCDESQIVGREFDEEILRLRLCASTTHNDTCLSYVAIVGMGGVGKTTLARRLYDNEQVSQHFAKRFWICVSDSFEIITILKKMGEFLGIGIGCSSSFMTSMDAMIEMIGRELKGVKFLLVLDDVWNDNVDLWDSLKSSLQRLGGSAGSMVLITSRSIDVTKGAGVDEPHLLLALSEQDSMVLLKQQFRSETLRNDPYFVNVGGLILKKCKGVPLAIKMIGRTLESIHKSGWRKIDESEIWSLDLCQDQNHILPWLMLSFTHLPSISLKQCFGYCSIFPKDCSMEKADLISLWLAQGFLDKPTTNSSMEERGEQMLDILTNNFFLEVEHCEKTGGVLFYKMHDLVHDLAVYVSRKDLFVWNKDVGSGIDIKCRHLVGNFGANPPLQDMPTKFCMKKLRTIIHWSGLLTSLSKAMYLRTLVLAGLGLTDVPAVIAQLKLLRYLDLSNNRIKILPEFITKLYHLQTLKLKGCEELKELPRDLPKLVNIRHIITTDTNLYAPSGLNQLTNLRTLPDLALRDGEGWTIDELAALHDARGCLSITGVEHVKSKDEARKVGLRSKLKITGLRLIWSENRESSSTFNDEEVLDGLQPHQQIKTLIIGFFNGENFPFWISRMTAETGSLREIRSSFSNLKAIKLVGCKRCRQLPTLGRLPCLRYLLVQYFTAVEYIDDHFYVHSQDVSISGSALFPALQQLHIWDFHSLKEWMPPSHVLGTIDAFPHLENLQVVNCPLLEDIPVVHLKSLKHLDIQELSSMQSFDIVKYSSNLTSLLVCDIQKMREFPLHVSSCRNLQELTIWSCKELVSFPNGFQFPASLRSFDMRECHALEALPDDLLRGLFLFNKLRILRCRALKRISISLQECICLKELYIKYCPCIEDPIPDLKVLQGIEQISVIDAGKLTTSVLPSLQHLTSLIELGIGGFKDEQEFNDHIAHTIPSLNHRALGFTRLVLECFRNFTSLPEEIKHFISVQMLILRDFDELQQVPDWLGNLPMLQLLQLQRCGKLKYLPSKQALLPHPKQFLQLCVADCPLIMETYAIDGPYDGYNITHLPPDTIEDKINYNLMLR